MKGQDENLSTVTQTLMLCEELRAVLSRETAPEAPGEKFQYVQIPKPGLRDLDRPDDEVGKGLLGVSEAGQTSRP